MNWIKFILAALAVFIVQYLLVGVLSIRLIRPDFIAIFVLYAGLKHGRPVGITSGFMLGLLVDLAGVGSYFGLTSLICTITGYLAGTLKHYHDKMLPYIFHLSWILIFCLHFLIFTYVRYQTLFESDLGIFWMKWLLTASYSFVFLGIINYFFPLRDSARA
ncbi:MAG: rod shape-determining protein MreD [Candidatus Neomarinimicrobiota bacterium]